MNGSSTNYVDYGWFIDNVRIVEGHAYDQEIQAGYFRSGVGISYQSGLSYYSVPTTQITEIEFAGETIQQGGSTHTGLYLEATVDNGGNVYTGTSATNDVLAGAADSMFATTTFTPANGIGTYDMNWTFIGDNADTYTTNDDIDDSFSVTEYTYGRDDGTTTGAISNVTNNAGNSMAIGNTMDIFGTGVIGALDIRISDDVAAVGQLIYGQVIKYDVGNNDDLAPTTLGSTDMWVYQAQTPDYEITNSDLDGFIKVTFANAIPVADGDLVCIQAVNYTGEVGFSYAQATTVQTVLGFTAGSTSDADLFSLNNPEAIMIRADMRDFTSIQEDALNGFIIGQNVPNPFDNNSIINYSLEEGANVSVQFVDVSGKVVKSINQGNQTAGSYQINLDGADFAEGVYFYTFTIGTKEVTKRMVVTK